MHVCCSCWAEAGSCRAPFCSCMLLSVPTPCLCSCFPSLQPRATLLVLRAAQDQHCVCCQLQEGGVHLLTWGSLGSTYHYFSGMLPVVSQLLGANPVS